MLNNIVQLRIWAVSKSINTIYFSHKLNNFLTSTDTHNAALNYFWSNLGLERLARKQSNYKLTAQLLSIGFALGLGDNSPCTLKCCEFVSYSATAALTKAIVLSGRGSQDIIKGQNGTLLLLRIKNPLCNMKNPISVLFHSCCKDYCASLRCTETYRSVLITVLHKENINHQNRSFLRR